MDQSAEEKPAEPVTDETIEAMVGFVKAAEILAKALNVTVSQAARQILLTSQVMARVQRESKSGADILGALPFKPGRVN